jgi:hypothetical protein
VSSKQLFQLLTQAHSSHYIDGFDSAIYSQHAVGEVVGQCRTLPAIMGEHASDETPWRIVNLTRADGMFDSIAVLGACDDDTAAQWALSQFGRMFDSLVSSVVETNPHGLLRHLNSPELHRYKSHLKARDLNRLQDMTTSQSVLWDGMELLSHNCLSSVLLADVVKLDDHGLMCDAMDLDSLKAVAMGNDGVIEGYDAIIVQNNKLQRLMDRLSAAMGKATEAGGITVTTASQSEPFKRNKVTQVAALFDLSDGQTVSVIFHNPDNTPSKLLPSDILISWKILLNKRDVSAAVQPNQGEDVQLPVLAGRIMKLVHANSARFKRTNAKKDENLKALADAEQVINDKNQQVMDLDAEIADLQAKVDAGVVVPKQTEQEPVAPTPAYLNMRDPEKVSMFNPYNDGDSVKIGNTVWYVKGEISGWYLTNTGNWKGTHPTINKIKSMSDLITLVERAFVDAEHGEPAPQPTQEEEDYIYNEYAHYGYLAIALQKNGWVLSGKRPRKNGDVLATKSVETTIAGGKYTKSFKAQFAVQKWTTPGMVVHGAVDGFVDDSRSNAIDAGQFGVLTLADKQKVIEQLEAALMLHMKRNGIGQQDDVAAKLVEPTPAVEPEQLTTQQRNEQAFAGVKDVLVNDYGWKPTHEYGLEKNFTGLQAAGEVNPNGEVTLFVETNGPTISAKSPNGMDEPVVVATEYLPQYNLNDEAYRATAEKLVTAIDNSNSAVRKYLQEKQSPVVKPAPNAPEPTLTKTDMGNGESLVEGMAENRDGTFTALTLVDSKTFKTRAGAERWLAQRGLNPDGSTIAAQEQPVPASNPAADFFQSIIDGTIDPLTADMDHIIELAEKHQGDATMDDLVERALEVINQAEQAAAQGV